MSVCEHPSKEIKESITSLKPLLTTALFNGAKSLNFYFYLPKIEIYSSWVIRPGSLYIFRKLPTYPSPKPIFCPKWEVSVKVGLGEGKVSSFLETYNDKSVFLPWHCVNLVFPFCGMSEWNSELSDLFSLTETISKKYIGNVREFKSYLSLGWGSSRGNSFILYRIDLFFSNILSKFPSAPSKTSFDKRLQQNVTTKETESNSTN